jgi:carboxypeptidase C (cathepsin A)
MTFLKGFPVWLSAFAVFWAPASAAQQYPLPVTGQKEIMSPHNPNIYVRYKTPGREICRTTKSSQKQFTGYIHLPPMTLAPVQQDYPINTFFWFVEAQENPESAPLTIWLNGGPGGLLSSLLFGVSRCSPRHY